MTTMIKRISTRHPNFIFWGIFLLLNSLLFLPIYWFFRTDISFWPWSLSFNRERKDILSALFLQRTNLDIFRLNVELLFVVLLWRFVPLVRRGWVVLLIFLLYLGQLVYAVYEGFVRSYYLLDPVFYNDISLFADGARYVLRSLYLSPFIYVGAFLLLGLLIGGLFSLHRWLFADFLIPRLSKTSQAALVVLGVLVLMLLVALKGEVGLPETAVTSFAAKVAQNVQLSQRAKAQAAQFNSQDLAPLYQFSQAKLDHKPDIYIIFLESYGSVLYKRLDYKATYSLLLDRLTEQLEQDDWAFASMRSTAPSWGGGSWLAYTSALAGVRIDSHAQYLALFNRYVQEPFPHLFNTLRGEGYRSYWLSSNSDALSPIEWQRYKNFYGVDAWLQFADMQYAGPLYGWGPSPPDQYALHFAHEYMNQDVDRPHVFFYITQNSHYPWTPLPKVASDWQSFNDLPPAMPAANQRISPEALRQHYLTAIHYELTMLVEFITTTADEDDIFVIIGDHQPARVATYADGWDTPIHIISKDAAFVEAFSDYGFEPGLETGDDVQTMRHEGIYSLLMHNLLQAYGLDGQQLPAYMPEGLPLQPAN